MECSVIYIPIILYLAFKIHFLIFRGVGVSVIGGVQP